MRYANFYILLFVFLGIANAKAQTEKEYRDTLTEYWENGQIKALREGLITVYEKGDSMFEIDGLVLRWHENGQLEAEAFSYSAFSPPPTIDITGKTHRHWYENGQLKDSSMFVEIDTLFIHVDKYGVAEAVYMFAYKRDRYFYYPNEKVKETNIWKKGKCKKVVRNYYVPTEDSELRKDWAKVKGYCYCQIKKYYENGQLKEKGWLSPNYTFGDAAIDYPKMRTWKYYTENGKLIKKEKY
jgi:antitoxin component YwqK of YwqJK toxin-antitoxin module